MAKLYILQSEHEQLHEVHDADTAMKLARTYALHHDKVIVQEYELINTYTVEQCTSTE